ncbi:MAG: hypothetical protein Fur0016_05260 [Anaerolineales bacterium]
MKKQPLWITAFLFLASLACSLPLASAPAETPPPLPTATVSPTQNPTLTPTAAPLYAQWPVLTSTSSESGQSPNYTIETKIPVMQGDDPRVTRFNAEVLALVTREVEQFKGGLAGLPAAPISAGSSFENAYTIVSPPGDVLSLNFGFYVYSDGAAHPYSYTLTYTYDLQHGEPLRLEQLFRPGADYLGPIASYCQAELTRRDIGFDTLFATGADPTPENYRNWNITPEGLLIHFDPYQVAAYAAGPQDVLIPYAELNAIINPDGPLAGLRQGE